MLNREWKQDSFKFVGRSFETSYADRMNKLLTVIGEANSNAVDYELTGSGGFGEYQRYDGSTLVQGSQKRGFKTIITPAEYVNTIDVPFKSTKVDKSGELRKVGTRLGRGGAMTVYAHALRMFANAFNPAILGGDGKAFAATDHPVASRMSEGRRYLPDPEAGTFSNLLNLDLSTAAIRSARTMMNRFVTPDGFPFMGEPDMVLVSPELEEKAAKLFGVENKATPNLNPDENSNAANPNADMRYMVIGGGADGFGPKQWAICDSTIMKEVVKIIYITRPQVLQTELDNPLIDRYVGYIDFGVGWGDSRQIIFSSL